MTIRQLHPADDPAIVKLEIKADIVAVHGLFENETQTWTNDANNVSWLRDLLPRTLPNVRILTYGYAAAALASPGEGTSDRLLEHAQTLIAELCADRHFDHGITRPLLFLCHGFGGLLVKRALAYSNSRKAPAVEHLRSIFVSTYGVFFLGTPHNGISKSSLLMPRTSDGPGPSQFMISLLKGSEVLNEVTDQFAPLMKRFAIYNFWEEYRTQSLDQTAYVVDKDSAAPSWDVVDKCGIASDHSGMAKFSSTSDQGYKLISVGISRCVQSAPTLIRDRWVEERTASQEQRRRDAEELLHPPVEWDVSDVVVTQVPNEFCMVPRGPSSYFTGRERHAQTLRQMLGPIDQHNDRSKPKVAVLFGLGGSGKTQFCLKYVDDSKDKYWGIFWIDASNEKNLQSSLALVGEQAGRGANHAAARYWLQKSFKPWLLIIDNADDAEVDLWEYCPLGGNGHVLITTRSPSAVVTYATVGSIQFKGMEPDEATKLLLRSAYPNELLDSQEERARKRALADRIAVELGYLALALVHAGTTIRRNIYTLEKYLHYYLGERRAMMSHSRLKSADDTNIITTWEIPLQRILQKPLTENKDAVDLMHIFAFLHWESIPEEIFHRAWQELTLRQQNSSRFPDILQIDGNEEARARFKRAVHVLVDHSIVEHELSKASFSMHPVIHTWAQERLNNADQKRWLSCALSILSACISPDLEPSGRSFRVKLIPHINSALKISYSSSVDRLEFAEHLERFAWVYAEHGHWNEAKKLQVKVIEIRKSLLDWFGWHHKETLRAQRSLSLTHWNLFEVEQAARLQAELRWSHMAVRTSWKDWLIWPPWRPTHLPYCQALDDLTSSLWLAGERNYSVMTGERAKEVLEQRLGPYDPRTLNAMFNLARTYMHVGKQKESYELLVKVLRLRKHFFGPDHPDTLMTRNELGVNLCGAKKHLAIAEALISNVLKARRRVLGQEHAYTLWSVNDLAKVISERGRHDEAIVMLEEIIPIVVATLGEKHVGMFMTRSNLGKAYYYAQRWEEAEQTIRPLLAWYKPQHPDWVLNKYGYAHILFKLNQLQDAEMHCTEVLKAIKEKPTLFPDRSRTASVVQLLTRIYKQQGVTRDTELDTLRRQWPNVPDPSEEQTHSTFDPYSIRRPSENQSFPMAKSAASTEFPTAVRPGYIASPNNLSPASIENLSPRSQLPDDGHIPLPGTCASSLPGAPHNQGASDPPDGSDARRPRHDSVQPAEAARIRLTPMSRRTL